MSVTEIKQAIGGWQLTLRAETPQQVLDALTFFGHIVLLPGQAEPAQYNDNLLSAARYVGVYRGRDAQDKYTLKGSGMAYWLGDEDGKGDVFETLVDIVGQTFPNTIRALLPPSGGITEGTLYSVAGTYTGKHQWQTPREAITYVTDLFEDTEWRVNSDATLDAGPVSSLYVTTPKTLVLRHGFGADLVRRAIPGEMSMGTDVEDVTTRVVVLAEGEGSNIATGSANVLVNPYKDLHGNPIKLTRLVSESATSVGNAHSRAVVQLNRYITTRRAVQLSTSEYDIKGTFVVGDYLDVYDPENGFFDAAREIYWQGDRINPMKLRCVEMTWPIPSGWTVAFRDIDGNWIDLTPYYVSEQGDTRIVVGELARGLSSPSGEPIGVRPNLPDADAPDTTIPAAPVFTGFSTGAYESDDRTHAAIYAQWAQPLNQDGSTITDGDHYEIRHRPNAVIGTTMTWDALSGGYDVDGEDTFDVDATPGIPSISDPFTRSVSSAWGSAPTGEVWGTAGGAPANYGVTGTVATHTCDVAGSSRRSYIGGAVVDSDVTVTVSTNALAVGGALISAVMSRYVDLDNLLMCQARMMTDQQVQARIVTRIGSVESDVVAAAIVPGVTHAVNGKLRIRAQSIGTLIRVKIWDPAGAQPPYWHLTAISNTWMTAGASGVRSLPESGVTNTPVVFSYDDYSATLGTLTIGDPAISQQNLSVWMNSAANAGSAPAKVVVVGSSTAAGSMGTIGSETPKRATTMWGAILRDRHNTSSTPGGYGVPVANLGIANEWTRSGGANVLNRGLGFSAWQMAPGEFVSRPWYGTAVTILFEQGPGAGAFDVSIDGGAATTVTPNTGAARNTGTWTSPTLAVGNHTAKITAVGTCVVEAVYGHDRDVSSGVQVWNGGLPGATTGELVNTPGLITRLGQLSPSLVVLMQTANDYASGVNPTVTKQRIQDWLDSLFATVSPAPDVLLVHQHLRFDVTTPAFPWSQYGQILQELADAYARVWYVDVSPLFPVSQAGDTNDYVDTDSTHLTPRGHQILTDALAAVTANTNTYGWPGWDSLNTSTAEISVSNGEGQITHPTFNILRQLRYGLTSYTDVEILASRRITYAPAGASTVLGITLRRDATGANQYWVRVEPNADQTVTVKITKYQGSVFSELDSYKIPGMLHTPGVEYWLMSSMINDVITVKCWQGTISDEPVRELRSVRDANSVSAGGTVGIMDYIASGATNPANSITRTSYFRVRSLAPDNVANAYSWDDLGTWDALTSEPVVATPNWSTSYVGWDQTAFTLMELGPGVQYELQIRALDASVHVSPWSASSFVNTSGDTISPSVPASPEVAASMIAVQIVHRLGKATGGTFNLEPDLHHFDIHASFSPTFYPDTTTKVGELLASGAMVRGNIPAVGTFKVDQPDTVWIRVVAVDRTGNKSGPSEAVQSNVTLIDDAHISDLTVSKVTAGTITAEWLMAGAIRTAQTGARVEMNSTGINAYNGSGTKTVEIKSSDGSATFTGELQTELNDVGIRFFTSGNNAFGYWSINDGAGDPLSHRFRQVAFDQGGSFGQTFEETIRRKSDGVADGSKIILSQSSTVLSHQPASGPESYISLGEFPEGGTGHIYARGKFGRAWVQDNNGAIWTNVQVVAAGFSGAGQIYGPTMSEFMCVNATITGTIGESCVLTTSTATGCTVSWTGAAGHSVYVWAVRVEQF